MLSLILMFPPPSGGTSPDGANQLPGLLIMFSSVILIFYFMMIRPQQKRAKEHKALLDAVKKGDKVVTTSGIHGTVSEVDETTILIQIADNTRVKFDKASVASVDAK
ncbi:MAG: preprotein translocase subunit YajC [Bacteroidetes bacterium]|nr:preprotein translocase subunit YajC [Bacteroidota bacterium]